MKLKKLASLLFSFLIATTAIAEEYNLHISDLNDCTNSFGGNLVVSDAKNLDVNVNYVDLKYDDVTNELTIEVSTDNTGLSGKVANSFYFGLNGGGMPQKGEIAFVYFDASTPSAPKATVYGYNGYAGFQRDINGDLVKEADELTDRFDICNNTKILENNDIENGGSWYHGYPVLTGDIEKDSPFHGSLLQQGDPESEGELLPELIMASDSSSVKTATSTPSTPDENSYIYKLVLDTTYINLHDSSVINFLKANHPLPSSINDYRGLAFGDNLGLWFWAASGATFSYTDNFISALDTSASDCSICDEGAFDTKVSPKCNGTAATQSPVEVGTETVLTINVLDEDYGESTNGATTVSYLDVPSGATLNPSEGGNVSFNSVGNGPVTITWTPTIDDIGTHTIGAIFTKAYGNGNLTSDNCPIEIEVVEPKPECKTSDIGTITVADELLEHINGKLKELRRSIHKMRRQFGDKSKIDNSGADTFQELGWSSYYQIVTTKEAGYFYECTNTGFCGGDYEVENITTSVNSFNDAIRGLKAVADQRITQFIKTRTKFLVKKKGFTRRKARRNAKARARKKYIRGVDGDGFTPSYNEAISQVETYIDTYGVERITCTEAL